MAVTTTGTSANFTGTGVSSSYAPGFYVNNSDQVKVYVNNVLQTIGDDYVVNNVGLSTGCTIVGTFTLGATVFIERVTPITQLVDTQNNETILEDVLDAEFDKLTMIAQEINGKASRAILFPKGEAGQTLPAALTRAGKFPVFGPSGELLLSSGTGTDAGLRTDLAATTGMSLLGFLQAGVGAVLRTALSKAQDIVNLADFGWAAANTGAQNKTALLAAVASGAKRFGINPGVFLLDPTTFTGLQGVSFEATGDAFATQIKISGAGTLISLVGSTNMIFRGITFFADSATTGTGGILIDPNSNLKVYNCLFYYFHSWAIRANGNIGTQISGCVIRDSLFLSNAWDGVSGQVDWTYCNDFSVSGNQMGAFKPVTKRPFYGVMLNNCSNGFFGDNLIWQATNGALFQFCLYNRYAFNRFEESLQYGVKFLANSYVIIVGNWINDNSTQTVNTYDNCIFNALTFSTVSNNICFAWAQPTRLHRNSFVIENFSQNNTFSGNKSQYAGASHVTLSADSVNNQFDGCLNFSAAAAIAAGSTVYLGPAGSSASVSNSFRTNGRSVVNSLELQLSAAPGAAQSVIATLMVNGVATALTCTVSGAGVFLASGFGSITLAATDILSVRLVYSGGAASSFPLVSLGRSTI